MVRALLEVDVEILVGVVIVHIHRDVKIYAANGVDQLHKGPQIHGDIVVHRDAQQAGDLRLGLADAAVVVGIVQLLHRPGHVQQGVAGQADHVDRLLIRIQRHQQIGVAAAVLVVQAAQEDCIIVLLALTGRREGIGRAALLPALELLGSGGVPSERGRVIQGRLLGKAFVEADQGGHNK